MRLYNADCFDVLQDLPDKSVDAIITDPPYGKTSIGWDTAPNLALWWEQAERVLRTPHSVAVMFADQPFTSRLIVSKEKWYRHDYIWRKPQHSGAHNARKRPFKFTEDIIVFSEGTANYYYEQVCDKLDKPKTIKYNLDGVPSLGKDKQDLGDHTTHLKNFPREVLEFAGVRKGFHPTQKPTDLLEYLLRIYTQEGDVVLDPFMGSGSTGVACETLNREFIGIEKNPDYFAIAGDRLAI